MRVSLAMWDEEQWSEQRTPAPAGPLHNWGCCSSSPTAMSLPLAWEITSAQHRARQLAFGSKEVVQPTYVGPCHLLCQISHWTCFEDCLEFFRGLDSRSKIWDPGCEIRDRGSLRKNPRCRIQDQATRVHDAKSCPRSWIQGQSHRSHPPKFTYLPRPMSSHSAGRGIALWRNAVW